MLHDGRYDVVSGEKQKQHVNSSLVIQLLKEGLTNSYPS